MIPCRLKNRPLAFICYSVFNLEQGVANKGNVMAFKVECGGGFGSRTRFPVRAVATVAGCSCRFVSQRRNLVTSAGTDLPRETRPKKMETWAERALIMCEGSQREGPGGRADETEQSARSSGARINRRLPYESDGAAWESRALSAVAHWNSRLPPRLCVLGGHRAVRE